MPNRVEGSTRWPSRGLAVAATMLLGACASGPATHGAAPSAGPGPAAGFQPYDGGSLGFSIDIAPRWSQAGQNDQGISFADPARQGAMLVHFESAPVSDLDGAAAVVMFELTNGNAGGPLVTADARLSGLPAKRVSASFSSRGSTQSIEAVVTLHAGRLWAVVLAGPPEAFDADRADYERMATTFKLSDLHPTASPS